MFIALSCNRSHILSWKKRQSRLWKKKKVKKWMSDENDASSKCECKVLLVTASVIYLLFLSIVHNKQLKQLKCRLKCHCHRSHRRRRFFWILYLKAFMPIKWAAIKSAIVWVGFSIFKWFLFYLWFCFFFFFTKCSSWK